MLSRNTCVPARAIIGFTADHRYVYIDLLSLPGITIDIERNKRRAIVSTRR